MEIVKGIIIEKYQSMLKNIDIKKYENVIENNKDDIIIGTNIIKDSKIINFIIFDFSNPRILNTIF